MLLVYVTTCKIFLPYCSEVDVVNPTLDADYHSLVVDAQVKLAVLLQDYINK